MFARVKKSGGYEYLQIVHNERVGKRAMAWLGEALPAAEQADAAAFAPRCVKDVVEEELFARRRDLFTELEMVFFDTTSLYFEGEGGEDPGRRGKSKDHRPDLPQMVVGMVLDTTGRPLCCELWPGNTTDATTLLPVVNRLRRRFGASRMCIVADRGMISAGTIAELQSAGIHVRFIPGHDSGESRRLTETSWHVPAGITWCMTRRSVPPIHRL